MKTLAYPLLPMFLLITLSGLTATAQTPMVSESWHVKAMAGHYGSNPKISSEFQLSAPGIIKFDASVNPWCECGKAGFQYFMFQHRAKNSSGDWVNGAAYTKALTEVIYTPEKWIDGKRLSWTWQWEVLPGAENYVYRILLFPNAYWTGNGHYTPEQILAISATFISQGGGNQGRQHITWAAQADSLRGRNGERFTYVCPAGGAISGRLWGTDVYTDDSSICTAAVHAGLISARSGGTVTIEIRAGASTYSASTRNGVVSNGYGAWHGSFVIVGGRQVGGGTEGGGTEGATVIDWATQADRWRGQNGQRYTLVCPAGGTISGRLWGTDVYTDDSSICTAAVHAGLIGVASGGRVRIEIRPGSSSYSASTRYGVASNGYGGWHGSFVFVRP